MREVDVIGVRVEMPSNQPIVLLREVTGERYLPIWIGAVEATAIAFAQQGVVPPRPLTHDLMKDVLEATGNELTEVRITEVKDGVFFATWSSPRASRSAPGPPTPSRWRCAPAPDRLRRGGARRGRPRRARRAGGRGREVPRVPRPRLARGLRAPLSRCDRSTLKLRLRVATRRAASLTDLASRAYLELSSL